MGQNAVERAEAGEERAEGTANLSRALLTLANGEKVRRPKWLTLRNEDVKELLCPHQRKEEHYFDRDLAAAVREA